MNTSRYLTSMKSFRPFEHWWVGPLIIILLIVATPWIILFLLLFGWLLLEFLLAALAIRQLTRRQN